MTLQEAKEKVAIEAEGVGYRNFNRLLSKYQPEQVISMMDRAAEIYAKSKWDEACEQQINLAYNHCVKFYNHGLTDVRKPDFKK